MKGKWKINFIIDGVMFLLMMGMAGIGILVKFVLLTGREAMLKHGSQVDLLFMGMGRHTWGTIHLTVSLAFLLLLALHIILHWGMVVALFRRLTESSQNRRAIAGTFLFISIVLLTFPVAVTPTVVKRDPLRQSAREEAGMLGEGRSARTRVLLQNELETESYGAVQNEGIASPYVTDPVAPQTHEGEEHERTLMIQGYMTLRQVAQRYSVPHSYLLEKLGIPLVGTADQRLGTLRRTYDFRMSAIEDYIKEYLK